jgi:hypothetical protein
MQMLCLEDYYDSSVWAQRKRRWVSEGGVMECFVCGSADRVDLHHKSYIRLGEEHHDDLVPLCRQHHHDTHALLKERPRACRGLSDAHIALRTRVKPTVEAVAAPGR